MPGLVLVQSNEQIEAAEAERVALEEAARRQEQFESSLSAHILRRFEEARRARRRVEKRMLANLRQRNGEYDDEKLRAIRQQGGSEIFMMLTAVKCRTAKAWVRDVLMPSGDKPWTIEPSVLPDLPDEVKADIMQRLQAEATQFFEMTGQMPPAEDIKTVAEQMRDEAKEELESEAEERAARMSDKIEDQLQEGGWADEFDKVISDVIDFPAGIIKGPVLRKRRDLKWDGGMPIVTEQVIPTVERVNPFNFYPAPACEAVEDGDMMERVPLTRADLHALIGVPGYDEEAIREALRDYSEGGLQGWMERSLENVIDKANAESPQHWDSEMIDCLEFWGSVPGSLLIEWGMEHEVDDEEAEYDICAWLVGKHVIKAELNPDPLGRKPYGKASFEEVPGSFWGKGVPELIRDCQDVCNAAARALVNNMGLASGPQVVANTASVPPGEDVTSLYPWKIWQMDYTKTGANTRPPVEFFQPNPMTQELMAVYQEFSRLADEHSNIPAYTQGKNPTQGAAGTASGLSMLMNAASKGIKNVVGHIDAGIISPLIHRFYVHNMLFSEDESIKGDAKVIARGAMSLVAKEQVQMRRQEFLQMTANPLDSEIMGLDGRAALLRELVQGLEIPSDDVVPDEEEMARRVRQMKEQQAAQAQAEQAAQVPAPDSPQAPQDPGEQQAPPAQAATEAGPDGAPMGGQRMVG